MKINLTPQRRDDSLSVVKSGDRLRINGVLFNFGPIPDGGYVEASDIPCEFISGRVYRKDGEIELTLILPHGANPSREVAFPDGLDDVQDGAVPLPEAKEDEENVDA